MPDPRTRYVHPPIPVRDLDWDAWYDGREELAMGRGATEQAAIADLEEAMNVTR